MLSDVSETQGPGTNNEGNFNFFAYDDEPDTLAARFAYLESDFSGAEIFLGRDGVDELRLRAIDLNNDGVILAEEAFKVLIVGQISNYLNNTTIVDGSDDGGDIGAADVAEQVEDFLNGNNFFDIRDPFNLNTTSDLGEYFDLDFHDATGFFDGTTGTLLWNMDFTMTMYSKVYRGSTLASSDRFDLGHQAEELGIALDPGTPPNPNNNPYSLPVARTFDFNSFTFGVRGAGDGTVANGDFFFAAPDRASDPGDGVRIGVHLGVPGSPYDDGIGIDVNVGFLGAEIVGSANDGIVLDMDLFGGTVDPSNPTALGFTAAQQGTNSGSGSIEAANEIDFAKLAASPIQFTLRIGADPQAAKTEITLPAGDYADTAAVVTALNIAIGGTVLSGLVTASDTNANQKVEFTVAATDPTPLGFSAEFISSNLLTATNPSPLIGTSTPVVVKFLLSLQSAAPKMVTVNVSTTDPEGPNGVDDGDTGDDNTFTVQTLIVDLQAALNAAGLGAITVGNNGDRLTLSTVGKMEITRTLSLDTLDQISLSELEGAAQSFDTNVDATTSFDVNVKLEAKSGLQKDDDSDYNPEGTIKVDIDPFGANAIEAVLVDVDPPTGHAIISASYLLTDAANAPLKDGASDMQDLLDFNVITVADILGVFTQVGNWFDRVSASSLLQGFDIPFGDTTLGNLLNLKDLISDTFLIDDRDDGETKSGGNEDIPRLLEWIGEAGKEQLRSHFGNAQQLESRLNALLGMDVDGTVFTDGLGRQNLTYHVSVADVTLDVNSAVDGDQPLNVPLDFEMNLDPLGSFETSGKLDLSAKGDVGFTIGIVVGNAVPALSPATEIETLNSDAGVTLNTNLALTTVGNVIPLVGRLSSTAFFKITTNDGTEYEITLSKSATDNNKTLTSPTPSDPTALLTDLNAALVTAGLSGKIVAEAEPLQGDTRTARIILRALPLSGIAAFNLTAATNNSAYTQLGLQTQAASTVSLVGSLPIPHANPGGVSFTINIHRTGGTESPVVNLAATETLDNFSLQSLVNDLNRFLPSGIRASHSGGFLVLSAVESDIVSFTVSDAPALGLDLAAANAALAAAGVTDVPAELIAGPQFRGGAAPKDAFGRLAANVDFTINGEAVALAAAGTGSNASIDDLIATLNQAIEANADLIGKIAAFNDGFRIALRSLDPSVTSITVDGLDAAESAALGIANGSSSDGLKVRSASNAPVSYGVTDDSPFTVTINGTTFNATLFRNNTILNRSLYDLAASLNNAINGALGGVSKNPLIATVQGGQIVIGLKTSGTSTNLIGDPSTITDEGIAPSDVTSFSLNSSSPSFADYLKLTSAPGTPNLASDVDFIIYFRNGEVAKIVLDALDADPAGDPDQKIDGDLGALINSIYTQVEAQAPLHTTGDPNDKFEIAFGSGGTSLQLIDRIAGTAEFRVVAINGSPAASQLGILGSDSSNVNINEVPAGSLVPDGKIDGGRIATIDLIDRVYLKDPEVSGELTVKTAGVVSAELTFGFAGIKAESGDNQTLFSAAVNLPLFDGQKTLSELFDALGNTGTLQALLGSPTLTLSGDFDLNVSILPGFDVEGFTPPAAPKVRFKTDAVTIDLADMVPPAGELLPDLGIVVETIDFGDLLKFDDINFDHVIAALQAVAGFLQQFDSFAFLSAEIPVLGLSVNDMLSIAGKFQQAVDDTHDNRAGGIQALAVKIREAFGLPEFADAAARDAFFNSLGIPVPAGLAQLIAFKLEGDVLRFNLRLPVGFSQGMNVDLSLGDILFGGGATLPVDIQGGAGLAASGYLDASLSFGIDLNTPANVLIYDDATSVFGHFGAGATNLQFNAAIGPISAFIKDGRVNLALDFNVTGDDGDASPESLADFLGALEVALTGDADATLPVFFPSDSEFLGDIEFAATLALAGTEDLEVTVDMLTLPDFSAIDLTALDPFGSIPLMLDALDFFLQGLQDALDGEVFNMQLPLIGNQLQGGADFIESMRRDLLKPLRQYIEQAPEMAEDIIQALLFELLGPNSAQGTINGGAQNIEDFLGIGADLQGLGLLVGASQDDIAMTLDGDGGVEWQFQLGDTFPLSIPLDFDLGIPALSLDMNTALVFSLNWGLAIGLGISKQDGGYVFVGNDNELSLTLSVDVDNTPLNQLAAIRGELGFLQLDVWEDGGGTDTGLEGGSRGTYLQATFGVDLQGSGGDTKVSFSELGSLSADVSVTADAEVNLFVKAAFNKSIIPDAVQSLLPEVSGRFVLDWETALDTSAGAFDFANSLNLLGFREVNANMGSFINEFLQPFLENIADVTEPLQPIIEVITAPIPVISDLAGQPISLVDIAGMTGYVEPAMIYAIADIISLINKIGGGSYGDFGFPLGDFLLIDTASGNANFLTGAELLNPSYKVATDSRFDKDNIGAFLGSTGIVKTFDQLLNTGTGNGSTKDLVSGLEKGTEGGAGFEFPIFEDPTLLFGLLLGQDIPLITYDLAPFGMDFSYVQKFPVWDALFIRIGGGVGLTIDLAFGYDTAGVRQFAEGGFTNPFDLLGGLYVSDTDQPTGLGTDVAELIFKGQLFAGAELNLGIASAGADGVITLTTNFDLYDPDSDGKVRIDELLGNFFYELNYGSPAKAPIAIFDVFGDVTAQLKAFVEALFFKIEFEITPPITLFEFSIPFERQPFLATERGDGSLLLNIGPNSAQRLNGDTRDIDETIHVRSLSSTKVEVWGMGINEGNAQEYDVDPAKGIFGYAGSGDDTVDLSEVGHGIVYLLEGGVGDDTLSGSGGGGVIRGEIGNDTLTGGDGADLILGGEGNDTIDGQGGIDHIFGDSGSVTDVDGGKRFRSFVGDKDGDDSIFGGGDNDVIFGGGGSDTIQGQGGNDVVLGDGGNFDTNGTELKRFPLSEGGRYDVSARGIGAKDTIFGNEGNDALFGGAGDDLIDGGANVDEIEGGIGFDVIYGGSDADTIYGGDHGDIVFGFRDPKGDVFGQAGDTADGAADGIDTIFGEEGNDYIRGNDANDVIRGGRGADIMFGDAGDDIMFGEAGGDIMYGGADNDIIDGADGADIVFGDDGLVVYIDFDPGVADFNFTGSRIRFLGGDQLIGDSSETLIGGYLADARETSLDLIVTEPLVSDGSDTIVGGDGKDIVFGGGGLLDKLFGDFDPTAPVPFTGPRPSGQDILIGDGGRVELRDRRNERAAAVSNALDGVDEITGNDGGDYLFGGGEEDTIYGFQQQAGTEPLEGVSDNDVILGDSGEILYDTGDAKNRVKIVRTTWVPGDSGKSDFIDGDFGNDIALGGLNSSADVITGDVGSDVLIGDHGAIYFVDDAATVEVEGDSDLDTVDLITSFPDNLGGGDDIHGNDGYDILIGGTAGDTMAGDNQEDILLGDNAKIVLLGNTGRLLVQVAAMPGFSAIDFITTIDEFENTGGADTMSGNADDDILFGGVNDGGIDTMYGDSAAPVNALDGYDILVGDNGYLDFTLGSDTDRMTLDIVHSERDNLGGMDVISGNARSDIAIGGTAGDTIYGDNITASAGPLDEGDILLGDNADVLTDGPFEGPAQLHALGTGVSLITTTDETEVTGGVDTIYGNAGADVALGGVGGDIIYGDADDPIDPLDADDVLLGDNGKLEFGADLSISLEPLAPAFDLTTLDLIQSFTDGLGGVDTISGNAGGDSAMGGTAGDIIYGDNAAASGGITDEKDLLLGDNGEVLLVSPALDPVVIGADRLMLLGGAVALVRSTDNAGPATGGKDTISGNANADIIIGGVQGDTLYGDRESVTPATNLLDGNDTMLGDNGSLEWLSTGRFGDVTGIDIAANNADLVAGFAVRDTNLDTLDLVTTEQPTNGARDFMFGDNGRDVMFGGTDLDTMYGDTGSEADGTQSVDGADLMFGDHGRLYPQFPRFREPNSSTLLPADFPARNFFAIDIEDGDGGEGDRMWGEEGPDVLLGQQGDDRMWGGSGDDDMIGGHNVSGGIDELTVPAVQATLNPPMNDLMDGGSGDDAMAGDNAIIWRRGDDVMPRFRRLTETGAPGSADDRIYTTTNDTITTNVGPAAQSDPDDSAGRDIELVDHADDTATGLFGADVMAGGADNDVMFGELADDLMQGDGAIESAGIAGFISRTLTVTDAGIDPDTDETLYFNVPEQATDGDDYMEGNGGHDLMFGGLGQDDMIGGSSALFGLVDEEMRPDGSDAIFGGAGIDIARNHIGDADLSTTNVVVTVPTGHARDADFIMGDNANVYRLVRSDDSDAYLEFEYDKSWGVTPSTAPYHTDGEDRGSLRIRPRGMEQLDYNLGGADYSPGSYVNGAAQLSGQPADNGSYDVIHGESGDDYIFGMTGSDILFGDGQDDSIVGGYGHDWISGGTGQDGVLGDDGLILISRNSTVGEPLYGVAGLLATDPRPKYSDGTVLNEVIYTPGNLQYALANRAGDLKMTADLVPFSFDSEWLGLDDEFPDNQDDSPFADDVIFGGLGSDFLHGASGDDAVSGAESLNAAFVPVYNAAGDAIGVLDLGYAVFNLADPVGNPINPGDVLLVNPNPGNVLAFNPEDTDGQHLNNRFRAGEFRLYDEYDPRRKVLLEADGTLAKDDTGVAFLLNFDKSEGVFRAAGTVPKATGQQTETYPDVDDDGTDAIFGDLGNDWLVGGTGRDDIYGGWGNDLLQADDNHETDTPDAAGLFDNESPDTHPTYEDRAYGGAGRDVLIGNTGGDRLIDWVGEYNSYLVPYAPFGQASVSRTLQPFLPEFLYALSASDGADPTRFVDAIGGTPPAPTQNNPNPSRNGEPHGELGLVLQKDFAWQDQTGAPADPQAGNIPGGHRDVLRSAGFNDGEAQGFFVDSGTWAATAGKYQVEPTVAGGDAVSVFYVDSYIPNYFEMLATLSAVKPTGGTKANAYLVFDYQSQTDFKFAGINVSTNKLEVGHRNEQGWFVDKQASYPSQLKSGTDYNVFLALNGSSVILIVNNQVTMTHTFAPRVDADGISYGLSKGMVGLGANNSKAQIDNVVVQRVAPVTTLNQTVDFNDGVIPGLFDSPPIGTWSLSDGRYSGTASATGPTLALMVPHVGASALIELSGTFQVTGEGGFVYDQYNETDFKFVAVSAGKVTLGHRTSKGWFVDATYSNSSIVAGVDLSLSMTVKGPTVSVTLNNQSILSHVYNSLLADGSVGLFSRTGTTSFDTVTFKSDDASLLNQSFAITADEAGTAAVNDLSLTEAEVATVAAAAMEEWRAIAEGDEAVAALEKIQFVLVNDLPGNALAWSVGDGTILVDMSAAGHGWFIDRTPRRGGMDLATVVHHEIGHVLGLEHESGSFMEATISAGERRVREVSDAPFGFVPSSPSIAHVVDWEGTFRLYASWNSNFTDFSSTAPKKKNNPFEPLEFDWIVE